MTLATAAARHWLAVLVLLTPVVGRGAVASEAATTSPAQDALVTVIEGDLPIILSAPHGGQETVADAPPRRGENIPRFIILRDVNTSELAEALAAALERELGGRPHVVIARFHREYIDANREPAHAYEHERTRPHYDAYHDAIRAASAEVRRRWGRGLLLDLHGQSASPDSIYRGTRNGLATSELLRRDGVDALIGPDSVMGHLAGLGYATLPEPPQPPATQPAGADASAPAPDEALRARIGHEVRFNGGHIVADHGSHRGTAIDAIQLEFGTNLRKKDRLEQTVRDTAAAVAAFARRYLLDDSAPSR